jgi:UDP:flavonoid glycosyltransferase YjiC (YdhE family)
MAAGLPCILTPALEPTFGGAALYAPPDEVGSLLARLDERRDELDRWTATVRELAAGAFGLHRIQRVYEHLGAAISAPADGCRTFPDVDAMLADDQLGHRRALEAGYDLQNELGLTVRSSGAHPSRQRGEVIELPGTSETEAAGQSTDFAIYMDLRSARSDLWRTIELAEALHQTGYAVSIVHVETTLRGDFDCINPLLDELSCGIRVYGRPGDTPLRYLEIRRGMVIAAPQRLLGPDGRPLFDTILRPITPGVVVLVDKQQPPEWYPVADECLALICGVRPRWATVGFPASSISQVLPQAEEAPELLAFVADRTPIRDRELLKHLCGRTGTRRGRIGLVDATQWQGVGDDIAENFGDDPIFVYATPSWRIAPEPLQRRPEVHVFRAAEISFTRFLEKVDLVTYFPAEQPSDQLLIPLLRAIQAGVLAIVDGSFKKQLGQLAIYSSAAEVESLVRRVAADPGYVTRTAMAKARDLVLQGLQHAAVRAIERLFPGDRSSTGPAAREVKPALSAVNGVDRSEVLFVSSNGVGLGHLTRLMAIARRLERSEPVFLTMSQAFQVVERSGWPVSYLPFHAVADCDVADWNRWLRFEVEQILSRRPLIRTIVFDGSNPYSGLLSAFATTDIRKVWVQRGMWKKGHMNLEHVRRGRLFDLIIEPGDVAESLAAENVDSPAFDKVRTDPIWLLDPDELLSRGDARAALGMTEGTRTCLVQLGSGTNRDNVSLLKTIIPALKRQGITPFIAEWLMGSEVPRIWPGVVYLRVFPLAKYFNAFDFCISAAGYNSFHELIGFALPTVFIANEHHMMDDQAARARFAMENDAAIWMKEDAVQEIETAIELIMREDVRAMMKTASTALAPRNGASEAARIVDVLSQGGQSRRASPQLQAPLRVMDAA